MFKIDINEPGKAQDLAKLSNELALELQKQMGGRPSDFRMRLLLKTVPNLGTTEKANLLALAALKDVAQDSISRYNAMLEYERNNATILGFDKFWRDSQGGMTEAALEARNSPRLQKTLLGALLN